MANFDRTLSGVLLLFSALLMEMALVGLTQNTCIMYLDDTVVMRTTFEEYLQIPLTMMFSAFLVVIDIHWVY